MAFWVMLMFFATLAAVVLTAVGVVLIWRTLLYTRAAANYTRIASDAAVATVEEVRKGSEAAQLNTNAAFEANALARATQRVQIRAWMVSIEAEMLINATPDDKIDFIGFHLRWRNNGQTPALRVRMSSGRSQMAGAAVNIDDLEDASGNAIGPQHIVGQDVWFPPQLLAQTWGEYAEPIVIRSRVEYVDVFDESDVHVSELVVSIKYIGQIDIAGAGPQDIQPNNFDKRVLDAGSIMT